MPYTVEHENGEQLLLSLRHSAESLRIYFEGSANKKVAVALTDNSTSMVSVREKRGVIFVRLHGLFLDAGNDVIGEIASFISKRKGRTPLLRQFIRQNAGRFKKLPPKKPTIRPGGKYHHLDEVFQSLNCSYFEGRISCQITWGTKSPRYAVKKRTLGSYSRHVNTIRINPVLDSKTVPRYYIEFVVYHEMLHADMAHMENSEMNRRRRVHSKEFKIRERLFTQYHRAIAWEKKN